MGGGGLLNLRLILVFLSSSVVSAQRGWKVGHRWESSLHTLVLPVSALEISAMTAPDK